MLCCGFDSRRHTQILYKENRKMLFGAHKKKRRKKKVYVLEISIKFSTWYTVTCFKAKKVLYLKRRIYDNKNYDTKSTCQLHRHSDMHCLRPVPDPKMADCATPPLSGNGLVWHRQFFFHSGTSKAKNISGHRRFRRVRRWKMSPDLIF